MKSVISVILIVCALSLCLFGCKSNIPEQPAVTYSEQYTYYNPLGATVPATQDETEEGETASVQYVQTINNIQVVLEDYYVFGNSVAKISSIDIQDYGIGNVNGYADVEMIAIGRRADGMRIGFRAYDAKGEIVRESYILALLDDKSISDGSVCENRRFDFPREAVKVEFFSYVAED